jgi:hypothetical protein
MTEHRGLDVVRVQVGHLRLGDRAELRLRAAARPCCGSGSAEPDARLSGLLDEHRAGGRLRDER